MVDCYQKLLSTRKVKNLAYEPEQGLQIWSYTIYKSFKPIGDLIRQGHLVSYLPCISPQDTAL